ncbi:hypothetical protein ARMGADRAFT_1091568 [Armillaria gallica]|uniref:Uncharacterized protein n=1 Tax=Armillaria gallica TaxID=47427 RepID=A0A2H3CDH6_ARMGA|nr:hypothetical protein ARMGADRAFT_1091568 [Armillaria gallica]
MSSLVSTIPYLYNSTSHASNLFILTLFSKHIPTLAKWTEAAAGPSWLEWIIYDLMATVMHKGTAAGFYHYIGFAMKSVFHGASYSGAPVADMDINALDTIGADED